MRFLTRMRAITSLFTVATIIYAVRTRRSHGRFLRVPFEFRVPTPQRVRERVWNPQDERLVVPQAFGVGWTVNLYQVCRRLGFVGEGPAEAESRQEEPEASQEREGQPPSETPKESEG